MRAPGVRSQSEIHLSEVANNPRVYVLVSAPKKAQRIPVNTSPVVQGLSSLTWLLSFTS